MSHENLKKNITHLMNLHNLDVYELERRAGLKKNNIYNIVKGKSKKPSAQTLQPIADVFGVTMKELLSASVGTPQYLDQPSLNLVEFTTKVVIEETKELNLQMTLQDVLSVISESINYSITSEITKPDVRFIRWLLTHKYQQRNITS